MVQEGAGAGSVKKEDEVTVKVSKATLWQGISALLAILLAASTFTDGFGLRSSTGNIGSVDSENLAALLAALAENNNRQPSGGGGGAAPTVKFDAVRLADDDAFLGDENAPLTIVEFSDFQCPFCRSFWRQTLPSIKSQYIDTGKVRFVYRDFPLTGIHPGAAPAAEAAECARDQGKFWEMHDKIFEEQDKQGQGTVQFGTADLKKWAADIGLDTGRLNDCLDSGKYSDEVQKDFDAATASGGRGTPYFVVGTTPLSGAQPFNAFKAVIEDELARAN